MPKRFVFLSSKRRFDRLRWVAISLLIGGVVLFEVYRWWVPYASWNPLWNQVTVGQSVIGPWNYGGLNEQGYLRFYSGFQVVLLPPTAKLFDANGHFVILEGHTPGSLTYARPIADIPPGWLLLGLCGVGMGGFLWVTRSRRRHSGGFQVVGNKSTLHKVQFRKDFPPSAGVSEESPQASTQSLGWPGRRRRFRAVRNPQPGHKEASNRFRE
ncbi:hypothetical protein D2Q93_07365 [Alicyclobacillaceae bacterium I2511]|nr:hypothetical protein D2Q93_07365 [Alicyclobacillaceae bacterium I2511]